MAFPLLLAVCLGAMPPRADLVIAVFEGEDYGGWVTTGEAFGAAPARGTLPGQMAVSGYQGEGLVNTYLPDDSGTGTLTSPPFAIERAWINFLIGGGKDEERLRLDLLVDGEVVRTATGPNDRPGGSERLRPGTWNVQDLRGREAVIRITDEATGGWGHLNIDHIVQSDRKAIMPMPQTVTVPVTGRLLHLPVRRGADRVHVTLSATPTRPAHTFPIDLAWGREVEWWAPCDLGIPLPAELTIAADELPEDVALASLVRFSDTILNSDDLYREPLRPQFHFSAKRGWLNDPNGLVWHEGEWHLYFQHNPWGWGDGIKYWGHAISDDLVHWREVEQALYPDELGPMWSGSAVIDHGHTSGLGDPDKPLLVTLYTAAGASPCQGLAYSNDRGRTLTKYEGNPVLPYIEAVNRDPKVIWYEPDQKWVMALYLDREDFALFESADLKSWTKIDDVTIPGCSECPEFFEIGIEGRPGETRWIFYGGNGRYQVGTFDGQQFTPESGPHRIHQGNCWYASQTFTNVPAEDGRRILIAWGTVNLPDMPFNQQMSAPIELRLVETPAGLRLRSTPVRELTGLRRGSHALPAGPLAAGTTPLPTIRGGLYDVEIEWELGTAAWVGLNLRGFEVRYDQADQRLTVNGVSAHCPLRDGRLSLRLLVDRASIEAWAQGGEAYLPVQAVAGPEQEAVELVASGPGARIVSGTVYELGSIWPSPAVAARP